MMRSSCPSEVDLNVLLTGELPEEECNRLEQHLEACAACRQRLDRMAIGDGAWLGKARAYANSPSPVHARQVAARFKSTQPASAASNRLPSDPSLGGEQRLQRLGDYEILGELGRGGMGVVFRARQHNLQRDVALKVILTGQFASASQLRRFHLEAAAAAKLDHPNIVPIYEVGENEGRHFFSMKLIQGGSLRDRRAEFQALPAGTRSTIGERSQRERNLARMMADIARAVHHAHQRGVLHRDLKPGNVLIDMDGQPHVTDFGLAKLLESEVELTQTRAVMGTPEYMSPEQAAGNTRLITTATDVYSLGTMLYELLAGRLPFSADEPMAVINRVINDEPKPPRSLNPSVSRDLETIALKCLEKSPARRYSSAAAVAEELERFTRRETILARPVTPPERAWRWARRKPALASLVLALHVALALGLAVFFWQWSAARSFAHKESVQRQRAERESDRFRQTVTRLEIERAETLLQAGNPSEGLARLARLIRLEPTNAVVATRLINALSHRNFCVPVARLDHDETDSSTGAEQVQPSPSDNRITASVNFSQDGRRVVTVGRDGTARLWDAETGKPLMVPIRHEAAVIWADFSPDGSRLVTACKDGNARVWNSITGEPAAPPLRHEAAVRFAAFSPDSRRIVTASDDGTARIWEASTGRALGVPLRHESPVYFAGFSPDGSRVLTAETEGLSRVWNAESGAQLSVFQQGFRREALRMFPSFVGTGERLLGFMGHEADIWNLSHDTEPPIRMYHEEPILTVATSADGHLIATASQDGTVRVWEGSTGRAIGLPLRLGDPVVALQFSDDGRFLLTGARDRNARVWDIEQGRQAAEPMWLGGGITGAGFARGGRRLATISGKEGAWLWAVRPVKVAPILLTNESRVDVARFSNDGRKVVTIARAGVGARESVARTWDAASGLPLTVMRYPQPQLILDVDFSPDGQFVATASVNGNIRRWSVTNGLSPGDPLSLRLDRLNQVRMIQFSPDGKRLLAASEDGSACLWEPETGALLRRFQHSKRVSCVRFSPNGQLALSASMDGTAVIWDTDTGQPLALPFEHEQPVTWADFDPSGKLVATAAGAVRFWSVATGQSMGLHLVHPNPLIEKYSFAFNADGTLIATAAGGTLQIWSVATGKTMTHGLEHGARIRSVQFSKRGDYVVTACDDGAARLWDAASGHLLCEPLKHGGAVTYAEFNPDGTRLLTSSSDGTARLWPVMIPPMPAPRQLIGFAEALAGQALDEQDDRTRTTIDMLHESCKGLVALPDSDFYGRWARWWLDESGLIPAPTASGGPASEPRR